MGRTVCASVAADDDLELAAAIDPGAAGSVVEGVTVSADAEDTVDGTVDVMVDFTHVDAARENVLWAAAHGVHGVVGTTGFAEEDHERFRAAFTKSNCVLAPNFAIGAVLMMQLAELAAPWFETVEIVELHHDQKRDAPSGTARLTAERIAAAQSGLARDPTEQEVFPGVRGGIGAGGIHVHSLRLRGVVAHQEVIFGTTGQTLTVRHDSYDRTSFMPGVLHAVKRVADHPGVTIGLDQLLLS
jgi:4-hydroxy-tetrahydrodipicolinate reductase